MEPAVETITFEDVLPIWTGHLWPSPTKLIKKVSTMTFLGGWDMSIQESTPSFFGIRADDQWIGVISGFATAPEHYRCRGLWVAPEFRGRGFASRLLESVSNQAIRENRSLLWTLPRKSSFPVYSKFGFVRRSDWFSEGMDFGPNCYASVELRSSSNTREMQTRLIK